jgi:hypothetical protein
MSTLTPRLTVADAAVVGQRHPVTIRRALEVGDLHGTQRKKGGRWLIKPECLEAWIDQEPCAHQEATVTHLDEYRTASTPA